SWSNLSYNNKKAIGATIIIVRIVLSIHKTINVGILIGISVANIQGINAETDIMAETDNTATINLVIKVASTTNKEGRNIHALSVAAALAANKGSGTCIIHVN